MATFIMSDENMPEKRLWVGSHHRILVILVSLVILVILVSLVILISLVILVVDAIQRVLSALVAAVQRVQRRQRVRHFDGLDICVILQCFAADGNQQSKEQERNLCLHFLP